MQWREHIGIGRPYTVQQVINAAVNVVEFHAALLSVAVAGNSSMVSNERLGRWFKKVEGQIVEGLTLSQEGMRTGYSTWCLRQT